MDLHTISDGDPNAGQVTVGSCSVGIQTTGGALRCKNRGWMVESGQAKAVLRAGGGRRRRRLRQADRAGRRYGVHSGPDVGCTQGQPVGGHLGPGGVRATARLENVPTVLHRCSGRLPERLRHGPRSVRLPRWCSPYGYRF